ncbi:uncharacterized protein [Antedon mediterranea]|uniref:uncharacterized protein n=1 Tax=Antedon mediterranea TaxID=105859 RepID=UPI003AF64A71
MLLFALHVTVFMTLNVKLASSDDGKCIFVEWNIVELREGENPPFLTSTGHCVSADGVAWMFGGIQYSTANHHSDITDQLWSYDTNTHGWRMHQKWSGSDEWPMPRHSARLCCGLKHLVLYGGTESRFATLNDLWIFDRTSGLWKDITSASTNTEHIQLINSPFVTSWCWNDSLWYAQNTWDGTIKQKQVTHFASDTNQWLTESLPIDANKTDDSTNKRDAGDGKSIIVFGSSVWFFPDIGSTSVTSLGDVQAEMFSKETSRWEFYSFQIESACSTTLDNNSEISLVQNKSKDQSFSDDLYENATIILGRKNHLSRVWSFHIAAKKMWLSDSCNNILAYGMPVNSCVLENSSRWLFDNVWYSHGGVLICKHNGEFYLDQLWSVESNTMTVCNDMYALSPGVIFMLIFFTLSSMAIIILCGIVLRKCVNGPYLKPPVHYGKAIRYSQLALEEIT